MKYTSHIYVSAAFADSINRYLTVEPQSKGECLSEDESLEVEATFQNGFSMAVQCCGVQYDPYAQTNTAWTQAVLFNPCGGEESYTEPEDTFLGEWNLHDHDGNEYTAVLAVK